MFTYSHLILIRFSCHFFLPNKSLSAFLAPPLPDTKDFTLPIAHWCAEVFGLDPWE